ncbi:MAG: alpha/beta fold hydrolase [Chlorobiaceae bacterium]
MNTYSEIRVPSGRYNLYGKLYLSDKKSPTILLLHGLGFHSFEYDQLAPLLVQQGYNALALDFRCCGKSDGKRGYWTLMEYVEDCNSALDYIRKEINEEILVFGNSLGATVGVYAAAEDGSHKIKSLIASNCATRPVDFGMNRFRKMLLLICEALSKVIPFRISVNYFIPYPAILSNPMMIRKIKDDRLISDARKFAISTYEDMFSWDATRVAAKARVPTLVLTSTEDDLLQSNRQSRLLFDALQEPKKFTVIETGHVPDMENPALVSEIIADWVRQTLKTNL